MLQVQQRSLDHYTIARVTGKVELSPHLSIGSADKESDKWAYGGYAAIAAQNDSVTRAPVDDAQAASSTDSDNIIDAASDRKGGAESSP